MPPLRPKSVTVIAILGIIFGAIGCLCIPIGFVFGMIKQGQQQQDVPQAMTVFNTVVSVASLVLSIVLLIASIGALRLRAWARPAMLAFAAVDLVYDVAKGVLFVVWMVPAMGPMIRNSPDVRNNPQIKAQDIENIVRVSQYVWTGIAIGLALVTVGYAIAVLVVMNKPHVKAAFEDNRATL